MNRRNILICSVLITILSTLLSHNLKSSIRFLQNNCFTIQNQNFNPTPWYSSGSFDIKNTCVVNQLVNGLQIRISSIGYMLNSSSLQINSVGGVSFPAPVYWAATVGSTSNSLSSDGFEDIILTLSTDPSGYLSQGSSVTVNFGYNSSGTAPGTFSSTIESTTPQIPTTGSLQFTINKPSEISLPSNNLSVNLVDSNNAQVSSIAYYGNTLSFNLLSAGNYVLTSNGLADAINGIYFNPLNVPVTVSVGTTSSVIVNFSRNVNPLISVNLVISGLDSTDSTTITLTDNSSVKFNYNTLTLQNGTIGLQLLENDIVNFSIQAANKYNLISIITYSVLTTSGQQIPITFTKPDITPSSSGTVRGWPNYIAMGAVTDADPSNNGGLTNRPVDALFKYSGDGGNGDPGKIVFPIYTMNAITVSKNLSTQSAKQVKPVMVDYTAEMSGGTAFKDFGYNQLVAGGPLVYSDESFTAKHFINLMMDAYILQDSKTDDNPYPGSIILNPDLLGMVQQSDLYYNGPLSTLNIPVTLALSQAVCFMARNFGSTDFTLSNNNVVNIPGGTPLQISQALKNSGQVYSYWDIKSIWEDKAQNVWYPSCVANPNVDANIPTFANTFKGWIQATNWVVKNYGPDVTFGWQENLWSVNSANWVHGNNNDILSNISTPVKNLLIDLQIYSGAYIPDFLVFDRYEMDDSAAYGAGYWYNARDWDNYLTYVKQVSEGLNNIPVMLWQIPGGHIQIQNEITLNSNYQRASTAAAYLFGEPELNSNLGNMATYLTNITLNSAIYQCGNSCQMSNYMQMNGFNWSIDNNKLSILVNSHVFSILWGGGQTQSVGRFPIDDNGWLSNKLINYYTNPIPLV